MKKIIFFIESMRVGGAQKNLYYLINNLSKTKHIIYLVTFNGASIDYKLDKNIHIIELNLSGFSNNIFVSLTKNLIKILKFRITIKKIDPEVVISFISTTNVLVIFASLFLKKKIIISERNDPEKQKIGKIWTFLRLISYRLASLITINSIHGYEFIKNKMRIKKVKYIPNFFIRKPEQKGKANLKNFILAVGRLHTQKGFDILINDFVKFKNQKKNNLKLVILGEGDELNYLKKLVPKRYKDEILFLGKTDPSPYYKGCKLFVIPSRYEGSPNVLFEAMAFGLTIIVRKSSKEIQNYLKNMSNAILIDRDKYINSIDEGIDFCMKNEHLAKKFGINAKKSINSYDNRKILKKWTEMINQAM